MKLIILNLKLNPLVLQLRELFVIFCALQYNNSV